MARAFAGSQRIKGSLNVTLTPTTSGQYSVACWARSTTIAAFGYALCFSGESGLDRATSLAFRGDVGGDPLEFYRLQNASGNSLQGGTYAADTWLHLGGRRNGDGSADLFVNGSKSSTATAITVTTLTSFVVGAFTPNGSSFSANLSGQVAEAAAWEGIALSDAEFNSLAKGFQPWRVRLAQLAGYLPLVRDIPASFTDTGSTVAAHPRIYGAKV